MLTKQTLNEIIYEEKGQYKKEARYSDNGEYGQLLDELGSPERVAKALLRFVRNHSSGNEFYELIVKSLRNKEDALSGELTTLTRELGDSRYEVHTLQLKLGQLERELEVYKKACENTSATSGHSAKVAAGMKLAYKEEASVQKIDRLLELGYSKSRIARELGVSRNTVYRRIKELEDLKKGMK